MSALLGGLVSAVVVDGEALLDTALASIVAGLSVTLACSAAIYGFAMAAEMRREDRALAAAAAGVVGMVGVIGFAAAIVVGVIVMVSG